MRGRTDSRYEQLETSPEAIEQELLRAVCEQRQTDLRRILAETIVLFVGGNSRPDSVCGTVQYCMLTLARSTGAGQPGVTLTRVTTNGVRACRSGVAFVHSLAFVDI